MPTNGESNGSEVRSGRAAGCESAVGGRTLKERRTSREEWRKAPRSEAQPKENPDDPEPGAVEDVYVPSRAAYCHSDRLRATSISRKRRCTTRYAPRWTWRRRGAAEYRAPGCFTGRFRRSTLSAARALRRVPQDVASSSTKPAIPRLENMRASRTTACGSSSPLHPELAPDAKRWRSPCARCAASRPRRRAGHLVAASRRPAVTRLGRAKKRSAKRAFLSSAARAAL